MSLFIRSLNPIFGTSNGWEIENDFPKSNYSRCKYRFPGRTQSRNFGTTSKNQYGVPGIPVTCLWLTVYRLIFVHHLNQHTVGVLGRDPYPPGVRRIGIENELIPFQGNSFFLQLLEGIFQARGGKSNVVQTFSMFFQALVKRRLGVKRLEE